MEGPGDMRPSHQPGVLVTASRTGKEGQTVRVPCLCYEETGTETLIYRILHGTPRGRGRKRRQREKHRKPTVGPAGGSGS